MSEFLGTGYEAYKYSLLCFYLFFINNASFPNIETATQQEHEKTKSNMLTRTLNVLASCTKQTYNKPSSLLLLLLFYKPLSMTFSKAYAVRLMV